MAPLWTPSSAHSFQVHNLGDVATATPGTSFAVGVSGAEGTFTEILADLAQEITGFLIRVSDNGAGGAAKNQVLDIGIDPAGGTSYVPIITNLIMGGGSTALLGGGGFRFFFPLRIPAGAAVAARVSQNAATNTNIRIGIKAYGQGSAPHLLPVGQYSETIGTVTNAIGVAFTPGDSTWGNWASLGTTVRDLWWLQLGVQINDTTQNTGQNWYELGAGPTGSQRVLQRRMHNTTNTELNGDILDSHLLWHEAYRPIPAGTELWVRGNTVGGVNSNYNANVVGIGG